RRQRNSADIAELAGLGDQPAEQPGEIASEVIVVGYGGYIGQSRRDGVAEQLDPFGLGIGRRERLDRLADLVEGRDDDRGAGVAERAEDRFVGGGIRGVDDARRKALFLGELLEL